MARDESESELSFNASHNESIHAPKAVQLNIHPELEGEEPEKDLQPANDYEELPDGTIIMALTPVASIDI